MQNTGTCLVIVAWSIVSWSGYQVRNELLLLRHFTKMENVRRKPCENSEPFLAEMKLPESLLYADTGSILTVKSPGRKRSRRTEKQPVLVHDSVIASPRKSIRRRSQ